MAKRLVLGIHHDLPVVVGGLLDMLQYARTQTVNAVQGLTVAQLDHRQDEASNSIGSLLWHIASVEAWYQLNTFDRRDFDETEAVQWAGVELGEHVKSGFPLEHYLDMLATVRERTERELRKIDEEWLLRVEPFDTVEANNYWKWFHVCEDEINHRGQIRWLRKRLPPRGA